MDHDVMDDLDRRLRAARPVRGDDARVDEALLARLRSEPIAPRRTLPRRAAALPVAAAGVTVLATATVMLAGTPGGGGGPETASAITQALRWFDPPAGTVLHARSVETSADGTAVRELWQSADDPARERFAYRDDSTAYELGPEGFYDPGNDTIYEGTYAPPGPHKQPGEDPAAGAKKRAQDAKVARPDAAPGEGKGAGARPAKDGAAAGTKEDAELGALPAGDPIVVKVRMLLQDGRARVRAREVHDGTDAWAIALDEGLGRPAWTLWVAADDGRPLELLDPGRDGEDPAHRVRWTAYDRDGARPTTLAEAHPGARVVDDPAAVAAAAERLEPTLR
jgi:hypothetical protein